MTIPELSSALAGKGLIPENSALIIGPGPKNSAAPWYVQFMVGVCAWFAGILLLVFVVAGMFQTLFGRHENWAALLVIGMVLCGVAAFLYSVVDQASVFGEQFALTISFAGQIGMAVGLGGMGGLSTAFWGMAVVEVGLTLALRNRLHRILSSAGAVLAWALATHELLFREYPGSSIWDASRTADYQTSLLSVLPWLAVWLPVAYGAWWLVRHESGWMSAGRDTLFRPILYGLIASLSIAPLATHPAAFWLALGLGPSRDFNDGSYGVTALWPLLAMFLALFGMALGFAIRNRPLMGLSVVFGLLEVSCFYYVLGTTLLVKSILMVVLGAGLLAAAQFLAKPQHRVTQ